MADSFTSSYNNVQLIRKKRDGEQLLPDEINHLITAYSKDQLPDYQMSAFLMAGYLNGMSGSEAAALTDAMLHSGKTLDFSAVAAQKVDKHSTGGVGDKLSLILAPIVASCGVAVPMISGRGLGHTGGTLDKLESITGMNVNISLEEFERILQKHHLVMAGQTEDVAPADKRMYALRDVTATVEFIPFIASSIMSKKLAEDIDGLVLDVKFGSGAFMKSREEALELAQTLVDIGESFGTRTIAYMTAMEQPLGRFVGNWLEAKEAFEALEGRGMDDILEISHLLAGTMIYLGGKAKSAEEGIEMSRDSVSSGRARQKWLDVVSEQQGDISLLTNPDAYPEAACTRQISAHQDGYISKIDAYKIGLAGIELGAGRKVKTDVIRPAAGLEFHRKAGDTVSKGDPIVTLYAEQEENIEKAFDTVKAGIIIDTRKPDWEPENLVYCKLDREGVVYF